jgi:hypothetical protein
MAAVNCRFPKENGHQPEKSTVAMTTMKVKLSSSIGVYGAFAAAKTIFQDIIEN